MKSLNLAGFVTLLATIARTLPEAEKRGLEAGAKLIEQEAKNELGEYQAAAGPFSAWASLSDITQAERVRLGYSADEPGLRSGDMRDSITHSVEPPLAVIGSDDPHLVYFEHGTVKQPPRSVLGGAAFRKGEEAANLLGAAVGYHLAGRKP